MFDAKKTQKPFIKKRDKKEKDKEESGTVDFMKDPSKF